jgi:hypothetical protein
MKKTKLTFLLSGGITNSEPDRSLGGPPSKYKLGGGVNNIFDDVKTAQVTNGSVDYRCFYVVNDGKKVKSLAVYLDEPLVGNVVDIGFTIQQNTQILMIQGNPANGSFQLAYNCLVTRQINWVPDLDMMTQRIAAIINSLGVIEVTCTGSQTSNGWDFTIAVEGNRGEELLRVVKPYGIVGQVFAGLQGGPINFVAPHIGFPTNPPTGVQFFEVAKSHPKKKQKVQIGALRPNDFFAVWLRRTIAQDTMAMKKDEFALVLEGES